MKDAINEAIDGLVSAMLDGQLTEDQRRELNGFLSESPSAVVRYHELLDNHEALCAIYPGEVYAESLDDQLVTRDVSEESQATFSPMRRIAILVTAASLLVAIGLAGFFVGSDQGRSMADRVTPVAFQSEQTIAGHAMLRRSVGLRWSDGADSYRDGDVLPGGELHIESGIAEVDFFCGATLTIEGPASLVVESDWLVKVESGRLRATVPPAARGFTVQTDEAEIIDLGTEFALDVDSENARVEVIDGEVALRGGSHDGVHLVKGQHRWLGDHKSGDALTSISSSLDVGRRYDNAEAERFVEWKNVTQQRQQDDRLIALYRITDMPLGRTVPNSAFSSGERDAAMVGPVQRTFGRFGQSSSGLEFDRIGARVRTRIDGEFRALTFSTWVRIDSLDQVYNALFMSDGYETGELHWQIREDGVLMFSVMVDDTQDVRHFSKRDGTEVESAGLHHVYYTPPIWDISKSGRWFHLAAVYDPANRNVTQYVNGDQVSSDRIEKKFLIDKLRIGPAEIGNWGQPFRKTPWFTVRNLNGTIDEMAIYSEALARDEIDELFKQGKPLGY